MTGIARHRRGADVGSGQRSGHGGELHPQLSYGYYSLYRIGLDIARIFDSFRTRNINIFGFGFATRDKLALT